MQVTFLGTASVAPGPGHDTASFLVEGRYLIDTGWSAALRLPLFGFDPLALTALFFTHCHHDHYLSLPQLLFARAMARPALPPLPVYGPSADLARVVERACAFLQADRFPEFSAERLVQLQPIDPGATIALPGLTVTVGAARHAVPAHGYRFTDPTTGRSAVFTGDTAPTPTLEALAHGADLLVTEVSYGAKAAPADDRWLHQGAPDAAALAHAAGVQRLALVHCREDKQAAALAATQALFPNTFWPRDGETVTV